MVSDHHHDKHFLKLHEMLPVGFRFKGKATAMVFGLFKYPEDHAKRNDNNNKYSVFLHNLIMIQLYDISLCYKTNLAGVLAKKYYWHVS